MGTAMIMIVGILTALSFSKKNMYQPWIYLVNVSLAVYVSLFASPRILLLVPDIPGLNEYRTAAVLLVTAVILLVIFYKIVGTVAEENSVFELYPLPPLLNKIGAILFAFFGGAVTAAFILLCFAQTPVSGEIKAFDRSALRTSSVSVMRKVAGTVNVFSMQSMSLEAKDVLAKLETDPPPPKPPEESLEEKVKAKKAAAAKKAKKKMRILENGVAVPVEEGEGDEDAGEEKASPAEKTEKASSEDRTEKAAPAEKAEAATGEKTEEAKSVEQEKAPAKKTGQKKASSVRRSSGKKKTSSASGGNTTVYGRAISKAVHVRQQVEKKSAKEVRDGE